MSYDIPYEAQPKDGLHSPAYHRFFENFFVNATGLIRHEVDLDFISALTPQETDLAKDLIRRNLKLRHVHIIEGVAALQDHELVPQLRDMFAHESDLSRRLTIAGTLWKLENDSVFPECLREMVKSENDSLKVAHIHQIAWLGDERTINLLIDILEGGFGFARHLSLSMLNTIEHERSYIGSDLPHQEKYYISRKSDEVFMEKMVKNLNEWYNKIAA
jgi:hypothetical protein